MRSLHTALFWLAWGALGCDPPAAPDAPNPSSNPPPNTPATNGSQAAIPPAPPSSAPPPSDPVAPPPADDVAKLAKSSNALGFDLYGRLREAPGNLVMSPASITTALAVTWGGAKGETAAQMKKVMHLEVEAPAAMTTFGQLSRSLQSPGGAVTFRIANQLFGEKTYTYEPSYLSQTKTAYGAEMERLDFKGAAEPARTHINQWVEGKTEKRITDLIPPNAITKETRLVLVNAIYFLGDWDEPFEKDRTSPAPFFTTKDAKKDVPMMNRTGSLRTVKKHGASALEIPYKGGAMSMLFVVPDAVDGLAALEKSLDAGKVDDLARSAKEELVWAQIPKFEVKPADSLELRKHLEALGMPVAFDPDKADFTGIANPPNPADRLVIGKVFHKGFIRVDEKGTEAAAATAVVMPRAGSAAPKLTEFKADRPFLFFLRDNASGLVLFMGRVTDPAKS